LSGRRPDSLSLSLHQLLNSCSKNGKVTDQVVARFAIESLAFMQPGKARQEILLNWNRATGGEMAFETWRSTADCAVLASMLNADWMKKGDRIGLASEILHMKAQRTTAWELFQSDVVVDAEFYARLSVSKATEADLKKVAGWVRENQKHFRAERKKIGGKDYGAPLAVLVP